MMRRCHASRLRFVVMRWRRRIHSSRSPQTPVGIFARVTRPDAQAVVGKLEDLPALVEKIDGGPAILIIGDVVAHSAPWRQSNPNQVLSKLLDAAE